MLVNQTGNRAKLSVLQAIASYEEQAPTYDPLEAIMPWQAP